MLVSGLLATLAMLLCERWYLRAFGGVFGDK
jgi:cobalamin synthase